MSYKITDTTVVDQSKNINNIGVATFAGPLLIGAGSSTGTVSQALQILGTSGAYIGGNLGIGSINPSSKLSVIGDATFSGIVTSSVLNVRKDPGTGIATDFTNSVFGNGWVQNAPASTTYYRLAILPVGSGGNTFDHLRIQGVLGAWTNDNQTPFDIIFSNRGAFDYKYISYGSVRSDVRILGISTNSTVEIWAQHQASAFTKLVYNITESIEAIVVTNPTSTTTSPAGTTVFDSSTVTPRFIINESDNVGINSSVPTSKLTVQGDALVSGVVTATSFRGDGSQLTGISAGVGSISISNNVTNSNQFIPYSVSTGSTTGLGVTNLFVFNPSTTSLGIGTTNPTSALTVQGDALVSGVVTATSFRGDGSQLTGISAGIVTYASTAGVSTSVIGGIGSITSLSVTGISTLGVTSTTNLTAQQLNVSGVSTLGNVSIGAGNTTLIVSGTSRVSGAATFDSGITISSGNLTISTGTASINAGMSVATGGGGAFNYLGTNFNFTVASQTTGNLTLGGPNQTATQTFGQSASTHTANYASGASGVGTTKTINFGTGGLSGSFTQINIGPTAGVGTVVINSGTNLGIGTINPTKTLTIGTANGNISIGSVSTSNAIWLNNSTASTDYNILSNSASNFIINRPSGKSILFYQADSTNHATFDASNNFILNSGNFAIGNFTPSYAIDAGAASLNKAGRVGSIIFGTAGTSYGIVGYNAKPSGSNAWQYDVTDFASWIQFLSGGHVFYRASSGTAAASITPLESGRFDASGNLGINSTSPTSRLDVIGDAKVSGVVTATTFIGSGASLTSLNASNLSSGTVPTARITGSSGDFTVGQNLFVSGNVSIGGTTTLVYAQQLKISDRDITLGVTTASNGDDVSTDVTANHGGVAIASTVGTPIINIPTDAVNTDPSTYKQIMWIRQNHYSGFGTDAWVFNYGVSIGNTATVQNLSRLTVGAGFTVYDNYIDVQDIRNRNINTVGVGTIATFNATTSTITTLNGSTATYTTGNFTTGNLTTGNIVTGVVTNISGTNINYSGISTIGSLGVSGVTTTQHLNVIGITTQQSTTFIGTGSSTGTINQILQVFGGAYIRDNVGIGTTIATSKLHVVGDTYITGILTANRIISSVYGEFTGGSVSGTNIVGTALSISGISTFTNGQVLISGSTSDDMVRITQLGSGNAFKVEDSDSPDATPFVIDANGSIGIGTDTISAAQGSITRLNIHAGTNYGGLRITNPVDGMSVLRGLVLTYSRTDNAYLMNSLDRQIQISTNGAEPLVLQPSGKKVGIGSTTPTNTLDVIGNTYISGSLGIGNTNPTSELSVTGSLDGTAFESYELDDLSTAANGVDNTFTPKLNYQQVTITNPFRLLITVNGITQSAFINNTDFVYQSNFLGSNNGYTIDSDNNIKFTESVPTGSDIVARVLPVSNTPTRIKYYPFKPTDILLGY